MSLKKEIRIIGIDSLRETVIGTLKENYTCGENDIKPIIPAGDTLRKNKILRYGVALPCKEINHDVNNRLLSLVFGFGIHYLNKNINNERGQQYEVTFHGRSGEARYYLWNVLKVVIKMLFFLKLGGVIKECFGPVLSATKEKGAETIEGHSFYYLFKYKNKDKDVNERFKLFRNYSRVTRHDLLVEVVDKKTKELVDFLIVFEGYHSVEDSESHHNGRNKCIFAYKDEFKISEIETCDITEDQKLFFFNELSADLDHDFYCAKEIKKISEFDKIHKLSNRDITKLGKLFIVGFDDMIDIDIEKYVGSRKKIKDVDIPKKSDYFDEIYRTVNSEVGKLIG